MKRYIAVIFTYVLFISGLVVVNSFAVKNDIRFDITRMKQHTLTKRTQAVLKDLKGQVNITALYVGMPPKYLEDMFKEYERLGQGKIKTEIIDPIVDIGYASRFGNIIKGEEKKVVVQSGKERRDIDFTEEGLTEEEVTNALVRVTRSARHVYFLSGHGEYDILDKEKAGLSSFAKLLLSNNVIPEALLLQKDEKIPENCDVLIIAGPKADLTDKEVGIIKDYLGSGGDALFLIEHTFITTPDKPLTKEEENMSPSLNNILNDWGVNIENDVVVDLGSHASGDVGSPATKNYMPHKELIKGLDYTFYVRPRTITSFGKIRSSIKTVPFVLTASEKSSWGEKNRMLEIKYDEGIDSPGPVPISFVIWEPRFKDKSSETRILVFTDADFLTNEYLSSYSNAQMGLNIINWLSEVDYQSFQVKKEFEENNIELLSNQKRIILIILILMPLFIILAGLILWLNTKR